MVVLPRSLSRLGLHPWRRNAPPRRITRAFTNSFHALRAFVGESLPSSVGGIGFLLRIVIPGLSGVLKGRIDGDAGVGSLAQLQEQGERTIALAVIRGFKTELQGEDPGVVSQVAKSDGGEDGSGAGGMIRVPGSRPFQFKAGSLNAPHAEETPAGDGHRLDQEDSAELRGWNWRIRAAARALKRPTDSPLRTTVLETRWWRPAY
jgi:hypothetical protein